MNLPEQLAKHLRDVHFGGNWTTSDLKSALGDVTWQEAIKQVHALNTIATLAFHINYYISAVTKVLQGEPLIAKDEYSFAHPPITSAADWQNMQDKMWRDAETFAALIARLPEQQLGEPFTDEKYGTYYRNLQGITEHTHYHLGQIIVIKKMLRQSEGG